MMNAPLVSAIVPIYNGGLIGIFRVIDRGPFTSGVSIDLTYAAARKLHLGSTEPVRAAR